MWVPHNRALLKTWSNQSKICVDIVNGDMNRRKKEGYWIHTLDNLYPNGLNIKALHKIASHVN